MLNNVLATIEHGDGVSRWAGQVQESGNHYFSNMAYCLLYALIGFAVVFIGISLLILIIWLVGIILDKATGKVDANKDNAETTTENSMIAQAESVAVDVGEDEISSEVKVAIVAAIMAYYSENQNKCEFKVKRIKRL